MSQQLKLREAVPKDAQSLLVFLKKASQQSDFISFDDMKDVTVQDEEIALDAIFQSQYDELIVAVLEDEIIGYCRLENIDDQKAEFGVVRSEEHTSELQSRFDIVCRLLLEQNNLIIN